MDYSASKYRDFYRPEAGHHSRVQHSAQQLSSPPQLCDRPSSSASISSYSYASSVFSSWEHAARTLPPLPVQETHWAPESVGPTQRIYSNDGPPSSHGPSKLIQPLSIVASSKKRDSEAASVDSDSHKRPRHIGSPTVRNAHWRSAVTENDGIYREVPLLSVFVPSSCMSSKHNAHPAHRSSSVHKYPAQIYPPPLSISAPASPDPEQSLSPVLEVDANTQERRESSQRLPSIRSPEVLGDHFVAMVHPTTYTIVPEINSGHQIHDTHTIFQNSWQFASVPHPTASPRYDAQISPRYAPVTSSNYVYSTSPGHTRAPSPTFESSTSHEISGTSSGDSEGVRQPPVPTEGEVPRTLAIIPRAGPDSIPCMLSATRKAKRDWILDCARQLASLSLPTEAFENQVNRPRVITCLYSFTGTCSTAPGDEGRTVIMHMVGRNKAEATALKNMGYVEKSCRRHYQRIRYHTSATKMNHKPDDGYYAVIQGILMERILDRVENEDPHAQWQICFTKSAGDDYMIEKKRMQASANGEDPDVVAPLRKGASGEHSKDMKVTINRKWARALLRDDFFEQEILSEHSLDKTAPADYKTTAQCRAALHFLLDILAVTRAGHDYPEMGDIYELPEIEFLRKIPSTRG